MPNVTIEFIEPDGVSNLQRLLDHLTGLYESMKRQNPDGFFDEYEARLDTFVLNWACANRYTVERTGDIFRLTHPVALGFVSNKSLNIVHN